MSASLKRTVVGSLAALAIGVSAMGVTSPAFAQMYHPPAAAPHSWGHGGPGAHGGHFAGGGGHWHGGGGHGWGAAAVGLGVLGLAAGAAIAAQPGPDYDGPDPGDDGCQAYRPVYDAYGNFMGRRLVNVC